MEEILWKYGFRARQLSWQAPTNKAGIEASSRNVKRIIGTLHYKKCITCEKGWFYPLTLKEGSKMLGCRA